MARVICDCGHEMDLAAFLAIGSVVCPACKTPMVPESLLSSLAGRAEKKLKSRRGSAGRLLRKFIERDKSSSAGC